MNMLLSLNFDICKCSLLTCTGLDRGHSVKFTRISWWNSPGDCVAIPNRLFYHWYTGHKYLVCCRDNFLCTLKCKSKRCFEFSNTMVWCGCISR